MTVNFQDAKLEQVAATDTTLYTCPSGVNSAIISFARCNCPGVAGSSITINLVKNGDSVATTNEYVTDEAIAAGGGKNFTEIIGVKLASGDFISAVAADASRLNLKLTIREIT